MLEIRSRIRERPQELCMLLPQARSPTMQLQSSEKIARRKLALEGRSACIVTESSRISTGSPGFLHWITSEATNPGGHEGLPHRCPGSVSLTVGVRSMKLQAVTAANAHSAPALLQEPYRGAL